MIGPDQERSEPSPAEVARRKRKFEEVLPIIRGVAREHGYAVGVHGSQERDLDLIAAPWMEAALGGETLVRQICIAICGVIVNNEKADPNDWTQRNPQPKPHGRLGWSIQLGGGAYVDLSVLPILTRLVEATERAAKREALGQVAQEIPSNWCDPLLTGAESALHGKPGTWGCYDIERLLRDIRQRVHDALSALESSGEAK